MAAGLIASARLGFAADVAVFGMIKSQEYVQAYAGTPVARATKGYAFNALVLASTNNVVTNASVKPANATPLHKLVATNADQVFWRYEERFDSQAALDAAYPNGVLVNPVNYAFSLATTNDGLKTVNLNYSLLALLGGQPAVPQILNFTEAQAIDHTADFPLQFVSSGNTLVDLVQVVILDASSNLVYMSPAPFSPGALTGSATSFVLPRNSLPPGQALTGHLAFLRPTFLETNAYPGAIGVPAVMRDTEFSLLTRPTPPQPLLSVLSSGIRPLILGFHGETNRNYHLQASADFTNWLDLKATNSATGVGVLEDSPPVGTNHRYYRIRVGQ